VIGVGASGSVGTRRGRASEREHWIALSQRPGIGPAGFAQLIRRHGTAAEAWRATVDDAGQSDPREAVRLLDRRTRAVGGRIVTGLDEEYPLALRTLDPRPPTLFIAGDGSALAVAAQRNPAHRFVGIDWSGDALRQARTLGLTVVRAGVAEGVFGTDEPREAARAIVTLASTLVGVHREIDRSLDDIITLYQRFAADIARS